MGAPDCPIERSVTVLDGKWTLLILRELFRSTSHDGEARLRVPRNVSRDPATRRVLVNQSE
jgi:DNA-binding HxlR family transcriptional regulator